LPQHIEARELQHSPRQRHAWISGDWAAVDRRRAGTLAGFLGAIVLAAGFVLAHSPPGPFDRWAAQVLHGRYDSVERRVAENLTNLGTLKLGVPLSLLVALVAWVVLRRRDAAAACLAAASATALMELAIKQVVARGPTPAAAAHMGGYGYPSGHTAILTTVTVLLWLILRASGTPRRWLTVAGACGLLAVGGVGWSRVALDVHYLTDVIAGMVTGLSATLGVLAALPGGDLARSRQRRSSSRTPSSPATITRSTQRPGNIPVDTTPGRSLIS
jgi:membrane-associated phospholipid phosphatase